MADFEEDSFFPPQEHKSGEAPTDSASELVAAAIARPALGPFGELSAEDIKAANGCLQPSLTQNEVSRLKALWHFTSKVDFEDKELQRKLQRTLKLTPRVFESFETVSLGLIDNDLYTAISTINFGMDANLCRRDSICSHTIQGKADEAFIVTDLTKDPRFCKAPFVAEQGGLRAYCGVPLTYDKVHNFGTLCVLSANAQEQPSEDQIQALRHLADLLLAEMVAHTYISRGNDRNRLSAMVSKLEKEAKFATVYDQALETLQQMFPESIITASDASSGSIELHGVRAKISDFVDGIWENTEAIEQRVALFNHDSMLSPSPEGIPYRAMACRVSADSETWLCVQTARMKRMYDHSEVLMLNAVARVAAVCVQDENIRALREAKTGFLRGIQHQLRTPLHGMLSASELLREDMHQAFNQPPEADPFDATQRQGPKLDLKTEITEDKTQLRRMTALLDMIDHAGEKLTLSINSLIDFDSLTDAVEVEPKRELCLLEELEAEVCFGIMSSVPQDRLDRIEFILDDRVPPHIDTVNTDPKFFKQILTALIKNALDSTESGSVIVQVSTPDQKHRLIYDITDTGCGIDPADHQRIFKPFEKVSEFTSASGLGLAISSRLAAALGGEVMLVQSELEHGSHFRLVLDNVGLACSVNPPLLSVLEEFTNEIPLSYWQPGHQQIETLALTYLCRNLEALGFKQVGRHEAALTVMQMLTSKDRQQAVLTDIKSHEIVLCLITSQYEQQAFNRLITEHHLSKDQFIAVPQPIHRARLHQALTASKNAYKERQKELPGRAIQKQEADIKSSKAAARTHEARKRPADSLRLLLVDDSPTNLSILRMFSQRRKHEHVCATDGLQALNAYKEAWAKQEQLTLIMMDLQMPVMDGIESTRLIREFEEENSIPPALIMIVTGLSFEEDKQRSVQAKADAFYTKPLSMRVFSDLIAYHFEKKEPSE